MSYQKWDQLEKIRKLTESLDANAHWPDPRPSHAPSLSRPVVPTTPLASRSICVEVRHVSSTQKTHLPAWGDPSYHLYPVTNCLQLHIKVSNGHL